MKAILLDMYGVIIKQTGDDFVPYVQRFFPELSREQIWDPWFKADDGLLSSLDVWRILGFTGDLEAVERQYLETLTINPDFYAFSAAAHARGVKLAVVSNDSSRWSAYLREKFDLHPHFAAVSISGDLKLSKPDPRIFQMTLDRLHCTAPDCVYVDDRTGNLDAAAKLGMKPILFSSRNDACRFQSVSSFAELTRLLP